MRCYTCCCCGERFTDARPPNPQRDRGYGTCGKCRDWIQTRPEWIEEAADSMLNERFA